MASYDAFVSYSHAKDKPIAAALQQVVQRLGKPWYRRRALRVFRDDSSLSATPQLWPSIEQALGQSRFLILLASPEAAASPWVAKEVAYWLDHKSVDTLLLALTGGVLVWDEDAIDFEWTAVTPLPVILKGRFRSEPKWVDLTNYRGGAAPRDAEFMERGADFAAAIRGIPKEDLLSLEVRQQRRALTLAWSAASSLLVLAVLAGWQWHAAKIQRDRAERALLAATHTADTLVFDLAREFRNRPGMPGDLVRSILERVHALQRQLGAVETSGAFRRLEAVALDELTTTLIALNDAAAALPAAERARAIIEKLVADDPSDRRLQRDLAVMLVKHGDVLAFAGRRQDALAAYRQSLRIAEWLAGGDPADAQLQRDVSIAHQSIGDVLVQLDQRAEAFGSYRKALLIIERLAEAEPHDLTRQRDLSFIYERCGNLFAKNKWHLAAVGVYRKALAIRAKLVIANPHDIQWQRDVAVSHNLIADALFASGRRREAAEEFRASLAIVERYLATDSANALWQSDLVLTLVKLADLGDDSRSRYTYALTIIRKLESEGRLPPHQRPWIGAIEQALLKLDK